MSATRRTVVSRRTRSPLLAVERLEARWVLSGFSAVAPSAGFSPDTSPVVGTFTPTSPTPPTPQPIAPAAPALEAGSDNGQQQHGRYHVVHLARLRRRRVVVDQRGPPAP